MCITTRRRFLRLSGMGAVAAGSGGLAGIFASGQAPAFAQGTTLHWLKFVDFVPVSDQLLRGKIANEAQKALGVRLLARQRLCKTPHHCAIPILL